MQASWRRFILWGTIATLIAASLVYSFRPRPVPVDLMELSRGRLVVTVDEEGETRVRDVFVVSAPVAGHTRRIEADVGDRVIAHESVIVEIQPTEPSFLDVRSKTQAEAAVRAAESANGLAQAELDRAVADLDFARTEVERARELFRKGTISQRELDEAERTYKTAMAARDRARAALQVQAFELEQARAQLLSPDETVESKGEGRFIPARAPVTGVILRIPNESERVVMAGEPLAEIGNPDDLEIVADLLSADAVKVSAGDRVLIDAWGGGEVLEGTVRRVEPFGFTKISALGIEEQRVNVIIDLTSPHEHWDRLGHGYQVETRIVLWENDDVLKLPLTALFRDGGGDWVVFVAENGRAQRRAVKLGRRSGFEAQIVDGLREGERVVVHPSDRVADGVLITARG
jgi:HlyD family secretion protein